ncbi:MAG: dihydroorotate dehydrogenase electron transfer subunit [Candidatus Aminicenantales bacterium]
MQKDEKARIVHKEKWGEYVLLGVHSPDISVQAHPGQFLMVRPDSGLHPLLRRPFSIHAVRPDRLEIFFQRTGAGTARLSEKEPGDHLDIIGPLGKGFSLDPSLQGQSMALVGGGRGIAPLYFLAQRLQDLGAQPTIFYGGKTRHDLPLRPAFEEKRLPVLCSTDDGSLGFFGPVTELFIEKLDGTAPERVYACGPEAMMAKIAEIALKKGIPAECSLEAFMGCGFGACWGCVRSIRKESGLEWVKICEEGPVFSADKIVWDPPEP